MAGHVISLVTSYRDEASAGLAQTSRGVDILSIALGSAIGGGLVGAARAVAEALIKLAQLPFKTAEEMGKLTTKAIEQRAGLEGVRKEIESTEGKFRELAFVVGVDGVQAFQELNKTQEAVNASFERMKMRMAEVVAPFQEAFTQAFAIFFDPETRRMIEAGFDPFAISKTEMMALNKEHAKELGLLEDTNEAREYTNRLLKKRREEEEKLAEIRKKEEAAFRKMQLDRQRAIQAALVGEGAMQGPQTFEEFLSEGLPRQGPMTWEEWMKAGQPGGGLEAEIKETTNNLADIATTAGLSISSGLQMIAASTVTGLRSIGDAGRMFFLSLVADILGSLARIGLKSLSPFLTAAGLAIGGPVGAIVGVIGNVFGGGKGNRATTPRIEAGAGGGNTYVFQGINTREMYQAVALRQGSIARANDLVALRMAEA